MTELQQPVNTIAPLTNVALCMQALEKAMNRPDHLPGMVSFYGPSGWGKSSAAAYAANKYRAYRVECKSSFTRKALLDIVLTEMCIEPERTNYAMTEQVAEQLMASGRPLIIDEFDHIANKGIVEVVRDIYESSGAAILLIGEERLEGKLKKWERFHNRMLDWIPAQPADMDDARHLRELYAGDIDIDDELLARIVQISRGAARRICVNLYNVRSFALEQGIRQVGLDDWGNRELFSGSAPKRRV